MTNKQTKTTSFYQELISSDWLGRSKSDYTSDGSGAQMGWEKTLTKGEAFSNFILRLGNPKLSDHRKVLLAKQACNIVVSRMNVIKKPVSVHFSNDLTSYQAGNKLMVSLEPLGSKLSFPSMNHRLDPVLGFAVHEMAHFLYTDANYQKYLMRFTGAEQKIKSAIMNIVEDERIEMEVGKSFRGFLNYIGKSKDYVFGLHFEDELKNGKVGTSEIETLFRVFIYLIRYPKSLIEAEVNKYEKELRAIQQILTPYPITVLDVIECCNKIYEYFKKFAQEQQQPQQQQQQSSSGAQSKTQDEDAAGSQKSSSKQKGDGEGEGADGGESEEDENEKPDSEDDQSGQGSGGDDEDDAETDGDQEQSGDGEGDGEEEDDSDESEGENTDGDNEDESDNEGEGSGDDQSGDEDETEDSADEDGDDGSGSQGGEVTDQDMADALDAIINALVKATPQVGSSSQEAGKSGVASNTLIKIGNYDNKVMEATKSAAHSFPQTENLNVHELAVKWVEAKDLLSVDNHYDAALGSVAPFASMLRAKLQKLNRKHTVVHKGLSEGSFDEDYLVDSLLGAKNVYKEEGTMLNRGAVIGYLGDESGSMAADNRWLRNMQMAVLFERALEGVNNIDFYCYGHTTEDDGSGDGGWYSNNKATRIHVYYEGRKKGNRRDLGRIYEHNTNRDGHAILEVVSRMRQTVPMSKQIILFMVSDGEPTASVPHGYDGVSYTKHCVDFVEKQMNATVIHIAIDKGIRSERMFKHYVSFTDMGTLVKDVGNMMVKLVAKVQQPIEL